MRSILYLFPLITISWSHGSHRPGSVISESSVDPYLTRSDGVITRDDLYDMEERLLRVIKSSNRRSRNHSETRLTGSSHGSHRKSDKIEIVIKGPPSAAVSGYDDVYCYPNCHANPQYASHDHSNCHPHCHHHAAAQAWPYYQPGHCTTCNSRKTDTVYSSHGSHLSAASQAPVAASVRLPRKAPKTRNFSVQVGSSLMTKESPPDSGK